MSEIELKARNLLASCLNEWGHHQEAGNVRDGDDLESYEFELRVIGQLLRFGFDTGHGHANRAPQWQPIETAPKDGTAVLVMQNNWPGCKNGVAEECNGHNTYVAAWWADERGGAGAWICYMDAFRDPECPIQPTHWQPMPPPPGVEG